MVQVNNQYNRHCSYVFFVKFEHIYLLFIVDLDLEQINVSWVSLIYSCA